VNDLQSLLRRLSLRVVFFSETQKSAIKIDVVRTQLVDYRGLYVDAHEHAGGLEMLWV